MSDQKKNEGKIRYAVVGIGHIAQVAVLPAFRHAENSVLKALVSGDQEKLDVLGKKYDIEHCVRYEDYDALLKSGEIDAVFIALPNHLHRDYTVRAAKAGVHVLCEKPMAVTEDDCQQMIDACDTHGVKLMVAYRLHFEEANLKVIDAVRSGEIGEPRYYQAAFSFDVKQGDIRLNPTAQGGGPLHDIGIYCINAARCVFGDEPLDIFATGLSKNDPKFNNVPETVSVTMRFPEYRVASFTCSFGSAHVSTYRVVGTKGSICVDPAFGYSEDIHVETMIDEKSETKTYKRRDQFAPELVYFSDCILENMEPEPDGNEGLADIRIIEAALKSLESGRVLKFADFPPQRRPSLAQEIHRRPIRGEPRQVKVSEPHH